MGALALAVAGLAVFLERPIGDAVEPRLLLAAERERDLLPLVSKASESARRLIERLWTEARSERAAGRRAERPFTLAWRLSRAIETRWGDASFRETTEYFGRLTPAGTRQSLALDRRLREARRRFASGNLADAATLTRGVLERYRSAGDAWGERGALHLLGNIEWAARRIDSARAAYQELADRAERQGDPERFAAALGNLASLKLEEGRYRDAAQGYRRLLALGEKHGLLRASAFARLYLGNLYHQLGLFETSTALFTRAEGDFAELRDTALQAAAAMNRGASLQRQGKRGDALSAYQRAVSLRSRSGDQRGRLRSLLPVAELLAESGEVERALTLLGELSALTRAASDGETLRFRWGSLVSAGDLQLDRGRVAAARRAYEEAEQLAARLNRPLEAAETAWRRARLLELEGNSARAMEELSRAAALVEALRESPESEEGRVRFLAARRGVYEDLAALYLRVQNAPDRAFDILERSRARAFLDLLQGRARVESNEVGEWAVALPATAQPVALSRVAAALPPGSLLLHYSLASRWLAVLALDRSGLRAWSMTPVEERQVQQLALRFLREASGTGLASTEGAPGEAAGALAALLFSPVEHLFSGARAVLVVPDGVLFSIPWPALPLAPSGKRLAENHHLAIEPSAAALVSLMERSRASDGMLSALVVGAPQTGAVPLGGARAEAEELSRILPGSRLLIGRQAEEAAVRSEMERYPLLHFATHARVDSARPLASGLLLAGTSASFEESRLAPLSPGDGVLTGFEVLNLRLIPGSLVTLAACETAPASESGEGVAGLARAFFHAGARAVVASLWPVEDRATRDLMVRFYRRLSQGSPSTAALAAAQAELAGGRAGDAWRHPYYWAGFLLLGDPR
jgi:CHAT domain-containing protein